MVTTTRRRGLALGCGFAIAATMLAGCLQNPNAVGGGGAAGGGSVVDNAETDGDKVVTVMGAFGGAEADAFRESLAEFEAETGIRIEYNPDSDFTNLIRLRTSSGQQPDIAIFPQPGGLLELAEQGYVEPIDTYLDYDELDRTLLPGFLESARLNGRVYGAPMRMAVKSIVWYPKAAYEAGGWNTAPANLDELAEVAAEISATGTPAWCMGWESGQGTGWPGTDWIEELMLRMWGPDVYDDWVTNRIPFNDERVVAAFDALGEMIDAPNNVRGGRSGILSTAFGDAMLPAFADPPGCYLERQGNFVTGFLPEGVQANLDEEVGLFIYPPAAEGEYTGQPMLGGGDLAALMNGNDPDAIEVMRFLTSDRFGGPWASAGGWLSPHSTFDVSLYPDEITRTTAEFAASADVFRYDGSDLMPNAVGAGSFWDGMIEWLQGTKTAEQVTTDIQNSWPVDDSAKDEGDGS
ncbi:MAG: sugar ABC transporter substrate-binding protein [Micrococcales bacterium 73-15]|nr:MAG: sugar ABC transporter substrate-binding protein [Micrococcales bacterium 73-15]